MEHDPWTEQHEISSCGLHKGSPTATKAIVSKQFSPYAVYVEKLCLLLVFDYYWK
jgi:hypothetical protein